MAQARPNGGPSGPRAHSRRWQRIDSHHQHSAGGLARAAAAGVAASAPTLILAGILPWLAGHKLHLGLVKVRVLQQVSHALQADLLLPLLSVARHVLRQRRHLSPALLRAVGVALLSLCCLHILSSHAGRALGGALGRLLLGRARDNGLVTLHNDRGRMLSTTAGHLQATRDGCCCAQPSSPQACM